MHQPGSDDRERQGGFREPIFGGVAFFGGSFDPPHLGHLAVARAARDAFRLHAVLFAPVGAQPLKPEGAGASFEHRLAMTRLAIEGEPAFRVSLADAPKATEGSDPAPNYTIDTLERLRHKLERDCALYCLMGADSFFGLRLWHRAAEIPFVASLIVASRPGQPFDGIREALPRGLALEPAPDGDKNESGIEVRAFFLIGANGERAPFYVLPGLDVEISASQIREWIRSRIHGPFGGEQMGDEAESALLPGAVKEYIRLHGLYR